jgi:D-hydroxyproline dehydrogenase subunit beta
MTKQTDILVVGGGIIGLAHAYIAASRGLRVALFERNPRALGASVRNFGLIWPIGQPAGELYQTALRSRDIWRELLEASALPSYETGSLHVARHPDELAVLEEFVAMAPQTGFECELLSPAETLRRSPAVRRDGLLGALWSPTELTVDPRRTLAGLPEVLTSEGVCVRFGTAVTAIDPPFVQAGGQTWQASRIILCGGDDLTTLYPDIFRSSGITRCKLQMMRTVTQPQGWLLGPALAAGLTLRFYPSFQVCASLHALADRFRQEFPDYERWGIHVLVSQTADGAITLGDSHEYGEAPDLFDKPLIDDLVLRYLNEFAAIPDCRIAQRWNGIYAKHPRMPWFSASPHPAVRIITATGGSGMTLSFGIAERTLREMGV